MKRRDLPLTALRAFETVARVGGFSLAAEELHVTQGAVSQQIKLLEEKLRCALVIRDRRGLSLTPEGNQLFETVRTAFDVLDAGLTRIAPEPDSSTLRFHVLPTFSIMWLMPQLSKFRACGPEIDVQIATSLQAVDLNRDPVDFTVAMKAPDAEEYWSIPILNGEMLPVVSPSVWSTKKSPEKALQELTQLYSENRKDDWDRWIEVAGLNEFKPSKSAGFGFSYLMYQAAVNGLGIAMAAEGLVREELQSGVLIAPWPIRLQTGDFYHLVCHRKSLRRPPVKLFSEWISERLAQPR